MLPSLAFLAAALILAITPGPGIAYVVARTVAGGRAEGIASCAGTAIGGMVHVVCGALGLSLVIAQSATAFSIVKYAGAAYLVYLGVRMLRSRDPAAPLPAVRRAGIRSALKEGVAVEALNVKTAMFFLAFIPQFVTDAHPVVPQFIVMGAICVALNTFVDLLAVLAACRLVASPAVRRSREKLLRRASGVTMLGLGGYVLARQDG